MASIKIPGLSVVIPVAAGRLKNLYMVLTSLDVQTYKKFEVIIVNDSLAEVHDAWDICQRFPALDLKYLYAAHHEPGSGSTQPRNRGARNALYPFVVFADSDVILRHDALEWYAKDFSENPDRIVVGIYHWLHPMRFNAVDVARRFDDIINERLPKLPIPPPQTHNVARDMRMSLFQEQPPSYVYRATTPVEWNQLYPKWLACFSGNIAWPLDLFWKAGGYWDELAVGAHEDGCSGLQAMFAGIGLSFDRRIIGGHQYHPRNIEYIKKLWDREIPMINKRFNLNGPGNETVVGLPGDSMPTLEVMSENALQAWGVSNWKREGLGEDKESGFRGM